MRLEKIVQSAPSWTAVIPMVVRPIPLCVADILVDTLRSLGLTYPRLDQNGFEDFKKMRHLLENE